MYCVIAWEVDIRALFQYPIWCLIVRSRKVSKPRDWYLNLYDHWNLTGTPQQCCRGACPISKRCGDSYYWSRGSETSRDLTVRRLIRYWNKAQNVLASVHLLFHLHRIASHPGWKSNIRYSLLHIANTVCCLAIMLCIWCCGSISIFVFFWVFFCFLFFFVFFLGGAYHMLKRLRKFMLLLYLIFFIYWLSSFCLYS